MTAATIPIDRLAGELDAAGGEVAAVLAYGSRLVATDPDPHSAYDLVVVVENYRTFYRALHDGGYTSRSVALMSTVSRMLAPTVIAFWPEPPEGPLAKCLVLSCADFKRALGPRRLDHFCLGRMMHRVSVVHARDRATAEWVNDALADARETAPEWTLPFLKGSFSADGFCRRMLEVSYAGEIRPERADRVRAVYEAQRETLRDIYTPILDAKVGSGELRRADGEYHPARTPSAWMRFRWNTYFKVSKLRATARWFKHMVTFDTWIPYILRKVERRTGMTLEVTPIEQRFPFPLLLPKVLQVLRTAGGARRRPRTMAKPRGPGSRYLSSNGGGAGREGDSDERRAPGPGRSYRERRIT